MICPACGRKLLSQASARCNWCGETVPDADFQTQASVARAEYFDHIAAHDAASLLAMGYPAGQTFGIVPLPPFAAVPPKPAAEEIVSASEVVTTEADDARARFAHLEL